MEVPLDQRLTESTGRENAVREYVGRLDQVGFPSLIYFSCSASVDFSFGRYGFFRVRVGKAQGGRSSPRGVDP